MNTLEEGMKQLQEAMRLAGMSIKEFNEAFDNAKKKELPKANKSKFHK